MNAIYILVDTDNQGKMRRNDFTMSGGSGFEQPYILTKALCYAEENGTSLLEGMLSLKNSDGVLDNRSNAATMLRRLTPQQAMVFNDAFEESTGDSQRVIFDLNRKLMDIEYSSGYTGEKVEEGLREMPKAFIDRLKLVDGMRSGTLTLADMAKEPIPPNTYLVDKNHSEGFAPVGGFSLSELTDLGKLAWADVLNAKVRSIGPGAYGTEYQLEIVEPRRMTDFSLAIVGNCSHEEYNKWFTESTSPAPEQGIQGQEM